LSGESPHFPSPIGEAWAIAGLGALKAVAADQRCKVFALTILFGNGTLTTVVSLADRLIAVIDVRESRAVLCVAAIAGHVLFDPFPVTGNALPRTPARKARVLLRFVGALERVAERRFDDEHGEPSFA